MRETKTVLFISMLFLFSGCVGTDITSQINRKNTDCHYDRLLVLACFSDLNIREQIENKFCSDIHRLSACECLKSYNLFFPGKAYTQIEAKAILTENKIDGILIFQRSSGVESNYDPEESKSVGRAFLMGNALMGSNKAEATRGYSTLTPLAKYRVTLLSTLDNQIAWYAQASTTGNVFTTGVNLIKDASNETVKSLIGDGIIAQKANSQ
jgi:hypothetical protein